MENVARNIAGKLVIHVARNYTRKYSRKELAKANKHEGMQVKWQALSRKTSKICNKELSKKVCKKEGVNYTKNCAT